MSPKLAGEKEPESGFLSDIQTIRRRARQHIDEGAVTPSAEELASMLDDLHELVRPSSRRGNGHV